MPELIYRNEQCCMIAYNTGKYDRQAGKQEHENAFMTNPNRKAWLLGYRGETPNLHVLSEVRI